MKLDEKVHVQWPDLSSVTSPFSTHNIHPSNTPQIGNAIVPLVPGSLNSCAIIKQNNYKNNKYEFLLFIYFDLSESSLTKQAELYQLKNSIKNKLHNVNWKISAFHCTDGKHGVDFSFELHTKSDKTVWI